ncbi:peroxidase isoform X6 [Daphnia magna]|uniref:peroxidase isoform X6 n=1 Tax=Daphnia magna TaxID=35525 RepID=UPI001E1BBD5D|nr:peroxidase isoform X6 [Daphnia magna]
MMSILMLVLALAAGTLSEEDASVRQAAPLPPAPTCDPTYRYRTFDGTCNNLNFPRFGQAGTIFQRLMGPATYANDLSAIRLAKSGNPLPSTRLISTTVTVNSSVFDYDAALITMQWGQFMDHDLTQTPQFTITGGCCDGGRFGNVTANPNAECLHIPIPSGDPVYSNVNCMNMIRSTYGPRLDGTMPPHRQQINAITHWIDGSQIYGNNNSTAQLLRDTSSGKGLLAFSVQNGQVLLPTSPSTCADCFVAGDNRVREQPLLTVMHTLWLREHNRVANALYAKFGSSRSDEFYYQEARRIVIAEFQHITYREYLPVILGPEIPVPPFDTRFNPAIFNEFAAAAFRMGHSQLRSFIKLFEADGTASNQSFFLGNSFLTGAFRLLNPKFIDNALRGQLLTPAQSVDECFAPDVTSQLFRTTTALGADLVAINMQRGRDHGLPPYVRARQIALENSGLKPYPPPPPPMTFDDLAPTHSLEVIKSLKAVYKSVEDIDLYIGGVTERPLPGAAVGPTFAYIIAQQFDNLRRTDRFFYANLGQTVSFTPRQFDEIRKVSLARIICDNNDGTITHIQPMAFRRPSRYNMPIPCANIPEVNFNYY